MNIAIIRNQLLASHYLDVLLKRKPLRWILSPVDLRQDGNHPAPEPKHAEFRLAPGDGRYPCGWVCLDTQLACRTWDSSAALYWSTDSEGGGDGVFYPSMTLKGRIHDLLYLPPNIRDLRFVATAEGEPAPIVLTEMDTPHRLKKMLRRTILAFLKYPREKRLRVGITPWRLLTDIHSAYTAASSLRARAPAWTYEQWIAQFDTLSERDRHHIRKRSRRLRSKPLVSLAVIGNVCADALYATIASLREQIYPHWELLIAADNGCEPEPTRSLSSFAALDRRIRIERLHENAAPPVAADNICCKAHGSYFGMLRAGDLLAEHALFCIAAELNKHPEAVLVYTDEDRLDAVGRRHNHHFKPDWNPQLLLSQNYLGGFCAYRTDALIAACGICEEVIDSEAYTLNLRITANADASAIRHIPLALYHRRYSQGERQTHQDAAKRALAAHLAAQNIVAEISSAAGVPDGYRIHYALPATPPLVSIIIPSRDKPALLRYCINSIRNRSSYKHFEIVVVDNQSSDPEKLSYLETLNNTDGITVLRYDQPFNFSAINNFAAQHCRGEVLCLLNNDTSVITPGWLEEMLGILHQPNVAVVGAKLYYADDTVQHAGDLVGVCGIANHAHLFLPRGNPGYQGRAMLAQDMSTVTAACLMVWKSVYETLGGFNARDLPVAFNDVDFCLRVREMGKRVVWTPWAELYHHESKSRGADDTAEKKARMKQENAYMRRRWRHWLERDPAYNPNLSHERPDFSLSHAPLPPHLW